MITKPRVSLVFLLLLLAVGCRISGTVSKDGAGVEGVTIVLSGDAAMTTVTDANGHYVFNAVKHGTYRVTMEPPSGCTRSVSKQVVMESDVAEVSGVDFLIETATERSTDTGMVIGFTEDNGSHGWLGIPYAKAPIGDLRWKAPLPAETWEGSWLAHEIGPVCTQVADLLVEVPESDVGKPTGCEDCLFLNVWAPAFTPEEIPAGDDRLPVMVWIHGGGNSVGHGGSYNGKELAERYNLVVVTFNYRLGPFGWFTHPALETGDVLDDSGNYGTLDIIRALTWVQANIGNFGGNPDNVTVFGESAGSRDALSMMVSPQATGLFHKAIAESGGIETIEMANGQNYIEGGGHRYSSREVVNKLLIADGIVSDRDAAIAYQNAMSDDQIRTYLYSKSNDDILSMYSGGYGGMISFPQLFRDATVFPLKDPLVQFEDTGDYNAVPLMIGSNRDETKLFMILDPKFTESVAGIPISAKDENYYRLYSSYHSDAVKATAVDAIAAILGETAGQPGVFAYRFDWDEEPTVLGIDVGFLLGAAHGMEISFAFFNFDQFMVPKYAPLVFTDDNLPGRLRLGASMSSYWAEFAYTGSPGRGRDGTEVEWKSWDNAPGSEKYIILDTPEDQGIRMSPDMITMMDLKTRLLGETGFTTQGQQCSTYAELFADTELWNEEEYANLGSGGCVDADGDGYYWKVDCVDDPSQDPSVCTTCDCGSADCAPCARCIHPVAKEFAQDGIDSNCDGKDNACLIATASFGTEMGVKISVLERFRDTYLVKSSLGRSFIEGYYRYSPPVADYISHRSWLRAVVRTLLLPVVGLVSMCM